MKTAIKIIPAILMVTVGVLVIGTNMVAAFIAFAAAAISLIPAGRGDK